MASTNNGDLLREIPIVDIHEGIRLMAAIAQKLEEKNYSVIWDKTGEEMTYFVEEVNEGGVEKHHTMKVFINRRWI